MKLKKLALLIAMCVVGTMSVGCGNNGAESASDTAFEITSDPITLKVWESTAGPDEFIKQAGEAFTAKYPNISIEYVNVEVGDTTGQIALDGPAGVGPDVFAAPHDKLGELVTGGYVLPTAHPEKLTQNVLGICSSALTYDGTKYGYPVSAETYALFYNKDLISEEEVPITWEDLKAFSETFNASHSNQYGFMMDVENGYYTIIFTTSEDNRLFGTDGTDKESTNINSVASVEGMKFFQSLRSVLDIPAADLTTAACDLAFSSGNVALYITGLWNVQNFQEAGINFGVAPLPSLPGNDTPAASFSGTRAMFVSAYSEYPNEAALFSEFLMSDEMQKLRFELTGALPAIDCQVDSPYIQGFLKQLDYAFPMPSILQMNAFWDAMQVASANIWDGADVQKELDACNAAIVAQ